MQSMEYPQRDSLKEDSLKPSKLWIPKHSNRQKDTLEDTVRFVIRRKPTRNDSNFHIKEDV